MFGASCLSPARFSMKCDILFQGEYNVVNVPDNELDNFQRSNETPLQGYKLFGTPLNLSSSQVKNPTSVPGYALKENSRDVQKMSFVFKLPTGADEVYAVLDSDDEMDTYYKITYKVSGIVLTDLHGDGIAIGGLLPFGEDLKADITYDRYKRKLIAALIQLDDNTVIGPGINENLSEVYNAQYAGFGIKSNAVVDNFSIWDTELPYNNGDGQWSFTQDPITGQITRDWKYAVDTGLDVQSAKQYSDVRCVIKGVTDGGIRVAGTTEVWANEYKNIDYAKMTSDVKLSKRQRITNIRDANGSLIYFEDDGRPTVFEVLGSTPVLDPFNRVVEYQSLLIRGEVQ